LAGLLGGDLRGERGRLARAAEARAARGRPRQRIALAVGDGDDGVVEGRVHVGDAVGDDALDLLLDFSGSWLGHVCSLLLDGLARSLAGPGIGPGALAAQGQAATVAQAAVAGQVHQALDGDADFAAQVALDRELGDLGAQALDFGLGQVADLGRRGDAGRLADLPGTGTANAVDALQPDPDVLLGRQVDAGNTRHGAALQTWRPGTGPGKVGTLVSELEILTGSRVLWKPRAPRRPGPGMGSVPMLRRRSGTGRAWRRTALPGPRATLARGSVPGHPCARP